MIVPNTFAVWHRLVKLHRSNGGQDTISFHLQSDTQQVTSRFPFGARQLWELFQHYQPDLLQEVVVTATMAPDVDLRLTLDQKTFLDMGGWAGLQSLLLEHGLVSS